VPLLVEKNSQWIERAFQKAKAFQGPIGPVLDWQIPQEITSLALDLTFWSLLSTGAVSTGKSAKTGELKSTKLQQIPIFSLLK